MICLGSSLRVTPAANMPRTVAERGGDVCIVNLQKTPLDNYATVRIFANIDDVMSRLMQELSVEIPEWMLIRRIVVGKNAQHMYARGVDIEGWPVSWIKSMKVQGNKQTKEPFNFQVQGKVRVEIEAMGWYSEPVLRFDAEIGDRPVVYKCEYAPKQGTWTVEEDEDTENILNIQSILVGTQ